MYEVHAMLNAAFMTKKAEKLPKLRNRVEQGKLLDELQAETGSVRRGDTGYSPDIAQWALGDAFTGSAMDGALKAYSAREKLKAMRKDPNEKDPSKLRTALYGALAGGGLGALAGGIMGKGNRAGSALRLGGLGAALGGVMGSSYGASQRIAARRAGLLRGRDDNTFVARTADRLLGGGGRLFLSQDPQYE